MPNRPLGPCAVKSCPGRATNGRYCADHVQLNKRKREDEKRPSAARRGYGRKWRAKRAAYLKAHSTCVECGEPATDVDHVIARSQGGTDEWYNLQALCHSCHSRKTALVDGGMGNEKKGWGGGL
jgi:5-methylcytosine-specific restriction enzyme A